MTTLDDAMPDGRADSSSAAAAVRALDVLRPAQTFGVGSLPHRSRSEAAAFAFEMFDIATIPTLPRRSPAEAPVAQALVGTPGVTFGQYGTIAVDTSRLGLDEPVDPPYRDARSESFVGVQAFLDHAQRIGHTGPVKWQFVGPISVGVALMRAGASSEVAFATALRSVSGHLAALGALVAERLPESPQLVLLNERDAVDVMGRDFPIAPDHAVDILSAAMAVVEPFATVGVHSCGDTDIVALLEAGPQVLSLPARPGLIELAGYLDRFLRNGGWIAWGVAPTDGPISVGSDRLWQRLSQLWCQLVERGCDAELLGARCLLTADCGLGALTPAVAEQVCHTVSQISRSARSTSNAARFLLGA
jgi:hypothetical protein